jgi:hypothetical protein
MTRMFSDDDRPKFRGVAPLVVMMVVGLCMSLAACRSGSDLPSADSQRLTPVTGPVAPPGHATQPSTPAPSTGTIATHAPSVTTSTGSTAASTTGFDPTTSTAIGAKDDPNAPVDLTRPDAFPLRVEPNSRQLWGADGHPFLLVGDAAWSLIAELDRGGVDQYLADRRSRGFNTVLVSLIEHRFSSNAPNDAAGDPPFTTPGDFSTPNEAYFQHADWVLQRLADEGFAVLLVPDYAGWEGGDDGWWNEMRASDPNVLEEYGRFVGNRYAHFDNIIWVNGGDYNPDDKAPLEAVARGIAESDPDAVTTAHLTPDDPPRDYWSGADWLELDNVYTYNPVFDAAAAAFTESTMPFFLMESFYENEHGVSTRELRTQAYHALLTGATGHVFGNNPIWHFSGPGIFEAPVDWQDALDGPGSHGVTAISRLMGSLEWWVLQPDLDGSLLVDGLEGGGTRAVAATADDDSWGIVYVPTKRVITVDLSRLAGVGARVTWYDASTGTPKWQSELTDDTQVRLDTPDGGDGDWVLLLSAR